MGSVLAVVRSGAERLRVAGVSDASREAGTLWAGVLGVPPATALLARKEAVTPRRLAGFERALARRVAGEPLAYVVGTAGFRHLELAVDGRVLIPRPETELLVDLVLAWNAGGRVVDVGTGSGCIGLALVGEGSFDAVLGIDCSATALVVARANAVATGLQVEYLQGDLVGALADGSVDVLVSNPPYLTDAEYSALDKSVRDWEPQTALASGPDGLGATRALLMDGRRVMRPGGRIGLEVDCVRAEQVATLARTLGWDEVTVTEDLYGRPRFIAGRWRQPR